MEARSVAHEDLDKALPMIEQHIEKLVAIGEVSDAEFQDRLKVNTNKSIVCNL